MLRFSSCGLQESGPSPAAALLQPLVEFLEEFGICLRLGAACSFL
jgi:hypothetical protein